MGWDKGLDFERTYRMLLFNVSNAKRRKRRCYAAILLIQLRNGSRVSEAIRAFKEFMRIGKSEIHVKVSKKKKMDLRLMIIPQELLNADLICYDIVEENDEKLVKKLKAYAINVFKINTHSLRYAFITHMLKQGVNPSIIAKITKHSRLDHILTYTQQKVAEDVLRNI